MGGCHRLEQYFYGNIIAVTKAGLLSIGKDYMLRWVVTNCANRCADGKLASFSEALMPGEIFWSLAVLIHESLPENPVVPSKLAHIPVFSPVNLLLATGVKL